MSERIFPPIRSPRSPSINSLDSESQILDHGSKVYINLYNINTMIGVLNWLVLRENQMGIFHAGVVAHGLEWSFMFFPSVDDNPRTSGIVEYLPKTLENYDFSESIEVGWTNLSFSETKRVISCLSREWGSDSYHLLRRNCLSFTETLVERLGLAAKFPDWLKNSCEVAIRSPVIASFVDRSWAVTKWCMLANQQQHDLKLCEWCAPGRHCNTSGTPAHCVTLQALLHERGVECRVETPRHHDVVCDATGDLYYHSVGSFFKTCKVEDMKASYEKSDGKECLSSLVAAHDVRNGGLSTDRIITSA